MPVLAKESICWERGDSLPPAAVISSRPREEEGEAAQPARSTKKGSWAGDITTTPVARRRTLPESRPPPPTVLCSLHPVLLSCFSLILYRSVSVPDPASAGPWQETLSL